MAMLKPPMLTGNAQTDILNIRDYLFRLSASLEAAATAPAAVSGTVTLTDTKAMEAVRQNAQELRSLIIKSADEITTYVDGKEGRYNSLYAAKSEFGEFRESVSKTMSDEYEMLQTLNSDMLTYQKAVNGQIIRGFIDSDGERTFGVAIARDLSVNAQSTASDGTNTYYELVSRTFGLYTSTGWQFWVNGRKAGWFDSTGDGILHVRKVVAEDFFQIGGKWQMKVKDGGAELEFVYIGGTA